MDKKKSGEIPAWGWVLMMIASGIGAAVHLYFHFSAQPPDDAVLTYGTVESTRQESVYHGFLPTEVLTIRIDNSDVRVRAELWNDQPQDIPVRVSFYYDGNPDREVFLEEESSMLTLGIILSVFFVISASVVIAEFVAERRG